MRPAGRRFAAPFPALRSLPIRAPPQHAARFHPAADPSTHVRAGSIHRRRGPELQRACSRWRCANAFVPLLTRSQAVPAKTIARKPARLSLAAGSRWPPRAVPHAGPWHAVRAAALLPQALLSRTPLAPRFALAFAPLASSDVLLRTRRVEPPSGVRLSRFPVAAHVRCAGLRLRAQGLWSVRG